MGGTSNIVSLAYSVRILMVAFEAEPQFSEAPAVLGSGQTFVTRL